jgi:hypothetical protein
MGSPEFKLQSHSKKKKERKKEKERLQKRWCTPSASLEEPLGIDLVVLGQSGICQVSLLSRYYSFSVINNYLVGRCSKAVSQPFSRN